jgi:hypothetical protein
MNVDTTRGQGRRDRSEDYQTLLFHHTSTSHTALSSSDRFMIQKRPKRVCSMFSYLSFSFFRLLFFGQTLERLEEETKRLATNSQRLAEFNADLCLAAAQSRSALHNLYDIHHAPK